VALCSASCYAPRAPPDHKRRYFAPAQQPRHVSRYVDASASASAISQSSLLSTRQIGEDIPGRDGTNPRTLSPTLSHSHRTPLSLSLSLSLSLKRVVASTEETLNNNMLETRIKPPALKDLSPRVRVYANNHKCITIADDVATNVGKRIVFFLLLGTQSATTCRYRVRCVYVCIRGVTLRVRRSSDFSTSRLHRIRPPMYPGTSHSRLHVPGHERSPINYHFFFFYNFAIQQSARIVSARIARKRPRVFGVIAHR